MAEPALCRFLPDEIEALIRLGRLDEARALLGPLQSRSARLERGWGIAVAQRCLGLLFGAAGDLARAQQAVEAALEVHRRLPSSLPFEEARSLLAAGEVHRRARHKHEALGLLRRAQAAFDGLGAPLWAARAGSEMDRIGVRTARPASGQALTVAEHLPQARRTVQDRALPYPDRASSAGAGQGPGPGQTCAFHGFLPAHVTIA
jgi:hypothetical protein